MNRQERKEEMIKMLNRGYSKSTIGQRFGVSSERVRQIIGNGNNKVELSNSVELDPRKTLNENIENLNRSGLFPLIYIIGKRLSKLKKSRVTSTTKYCIGCERELPKTEFTNHPDHRDGKYTYCMDCSARRNRELYNKNPEIFKESNKRWTERNPEKRRAHIMINVAVKSGKIKRPSICESCKETKKVEAHHHNGYSEEHILDVVWLCRKCHRRADMLMRKTAMEQR